MAPAPRRALVLAVALALAVGGCSAKPKPLVRPKISFARAGDSLLERHGVPGVVIAQVERGQVVAIEAFGYADIESREPMTGDTVFQVGSVSKSVAAWALMRLVQDERLELDIPLSYYLKPWPLPASPDTARLTLRRVLSHTGGTNVPGYLGFAPAEPAQTLRESIAGARDADGARLRIERVPGEEWRYSGGGYTLAELTAEAVSGRRFPDFAHRTVLAPLGMTRSSFRQPSEQLPARLATSYDENEKPMPVRRYAARAAAGLYSSGNDLGRWVAALSRGPLPADLPGRGALSPHTLAMMVSPQPAADCDLVFSGCQFGLGYALVRLDGTADEMLVYHPGDNLPGWHSFIAAVPSRRSGIAILTNGSAGRELRLDAFCSWLAAQRAGSVPECRGGHYVAPEPPD